HQPSANCKLADGVRSSTSTTIPVGQSRATVAWATHGSPSSAFSAPYTSSTTRGRPSMIPLSVSTERTSTRSAPLTTIESTDMNGDWTYHTRTATTARTTSMRRSRLRLERARSSATRRRLSTKRWSMSGSFVEADELDLRFQPDSGLFTDLPPDRLDEFFHIGGRGVPLGLDEVGVAG